MSVKHTVEFIRKSNPTPQVLAALDADLADVALMTETAIKEKTPVVTGRLRASMVARKLGSLDYEVATNVDYAPYVEWGTSAFAPRAMMRKGGAAVKALGSKILRRSNKMPSGK